MVSANNRKYVVYVYEGPIYVMHKSPHVSRCYPRSSHQGIVLYLVVTQLHCCPFRGDPARAQDVCQQEFSYTYPGLSRRCPRLHDCK